MSRSSWCLSQSFEFFQDNDISPCAKSTVVDGIVPSCCTLLSLFLLGLSIKKEYQKQKHNQHVKQNGGPSIAKNVKDPKSITDAENLVISKQINKAGLSWGGLSLLEFWSGTPSRPNINVPLSTSQRSKNYITTTLSIIIDCIQLAKVFSIFFGIAAAKQNNNNNNNSSLTIGSGWSVILLANWVYFSLLSITRLWATRKHRSNNIANSLDTHIILLLSILPIISFVDLRSSIINHVQLNSSHSKSLLIFDCIIFGAVISCTCLEYLISRPSPWIHHNTSSYDPKKSKHHSNSSYQNGNHNPPDERSPLLNNTSSDTTCSTSSTMIASESISSKDGDTSKHPPSSELESSVLSYIFFGFFDNFMFSYWRTKPTPEQIPELRPDDQAAPIIQRYRAETSNMNGSLLKKIIYFNRHELIHQALWSLPQPFLLVLPSVLLKVLLDSITLRGANDPNSPPFHVIVLVVILLPIVQLVESLAASQSLIIGRRLCIRVRALLQAEMFAKTLRNSDQTTPDSFSDNDSDKHSDGNNEDEEDDDEYAGKASVGKIQVLVSNDVFRISELWAYLNWFVSMPLVMIFASILLFQVIGLAALAALVTFVLLFVYSFFFNKKFLVHQERMRKASDDRLKLATEVIQAIKTIKFFAWEESFLKKMEEPRERELSELLKRSIALAFTCVGFLAGPNLIAAIAFGFHTFVLQKPLTASVAFTSLSLINALRSPLDALADMIAHVLEANISMKRIEDFLNEDETEKFDILNPQHPRNNRNSNGDGDDDIVGFSDATFAWYRNDGDQSIENFSLKIGTIHFPKERLTCIVGPVGSGKSSLLLALLGEMNLVQGQVHLPSPPMRTIGDPNTLTNTVAYCGQTAWLLSETLKENILFGARFDKNRYAEVIRACALEPDIASLDLGDETEVGEKGTVLSGGQKARICLARALYSSAKVVLLDDVLSAVDSHTSEHLHDHCLNGPLMKGRTCILVTHAVPLCAPSSDLVVMLQGGQIENYGDPKELGLVNEAYVKSRAASIRAEKQSSSSSLVNKLGTNSKGNLLQQEQHQVEEFLDQQAVDRKNKLKLIKDEEQNTGAVSFQVYKLYAVAFGGWPAWLTSIALYGVAQVTDVTLQWWLRAWAGAYGSVEPSVFSVSTASSLIQPLTVKLAQLAQIMAPIQTIATTANPTTQDQDDDAERTLYYMKIYLALTAATFVLTWARMVHFLICGVRAGRNLYKRLILRLLGANVRFFETTPVGRITNRLLRDVESVDDDIGTIGMFLMMEIMWTAGIIGAIALVIPSFLIAALVIFCIYFVVAMFYLGSSREVKRLESITRSPIYALFGEAMQGVATIRAYGDIGRFLDNMFVYINDNNRPFFSLWCANRWLSVRIDGTSALVIFVTAIAVLIQSSRDAASAGFVLSFALLFQERLLWVVRSVATLEIAFNSVERVQEYLEIDQERTEGINPPAYWPSRDGKINVQNLCVRYHEDFSRVLHNVSFQVEPRQKVGIVGRTGSGKSTLALSFFRFVEAEEGTITIDGLDIDKVKLNELRKRLVILPQDATLFNGTVRFNLDPFDQHDDSELWDALHKVGMGPRTPSSTPAVSRTASKIGTGGSGSRPSSVLGMSTTLDEAEAEARVERHVISSLEMLVEDGGKNFSAGQRQLLALARGLLRLKHSSIVILDEASASLDSKTDEQVQKTIRDEMGEATLLCIAHRLRTIMSFDKVLVLGEGKVLEYDEPAKLLEDSDSEFKKLCLRTGEADVLYKMASKARNERLAKVSS